MAKTADTIAIYSRKSRYTGKGESIGNQIDLCREYIRTHYGDAAAEHAVVFEDEGFSGGNLNRPDFKKMMTAAKERKIRAIVVYRLDRISRNISDFSSLIEELGRLGIDFVSIRESFDTSSPMGRAMMYIASVFSQLERETIAERIRIICTNWQRPGAGWAALPPRDTPPRASRASRWTARPKRPASSSCCRMRQRSSTKFSTSMSSTIP